MRKLFITILFLLAFVSASYGQVNNQRSQAQIIYKSALPATCTPNQSLIYAVFGSLPINYYVCVNTNTFSNISSPSVTLTSTRIGFGSGSNLLTSSATFTYNDTTKTQTITNSSGGTFLALNGSSDTSAVKFGAGSHPGNGGGIIFPFVGGDISTGPGIWWCAGAYNQCNGLTISNGLNYQGASSTHSPVKFRTGTGTSTPGTVRMEFRPDDSKVFFGPNSTTNATLEVDSSTASGATGIKITNAAAGSGVSVAVTSSGSNDGLTLTPKGTGFININGSFSLLNTVTAGGTTGNQTIDRPSGTVNIAAAGTSITVTNNKVSATSICFAVIRTADDTATIKNVVPGAGSFVITLSAAATAETSIGFLCINP